jgi:hypothetical protein
VARLEFVLSIHPVSELRKSCPFTLTFILEKWLAGAKNMSVHREGSLVHFGLISIFAALGVNKATCYFNTVHPPPHHHNHHIVESDDDRAAR